MDPTIGGVILVGLLAFLGVSLQIKANEKNISKQVKEELEKEMKLLVERIRIEREDKWWHLKFDSFTNFQSSITVLLLCVVSMDVENFEKSNSSMRLSAINMATIFSDKDMEKLILDIIEIFREPLNIVAGNVNLDKGEKIFKKIILNAKADLFIK